MGEHRANAAAARAWGAALVVGALIMVAGCAGGLASDPTPAARCEPGDTAMVRDLLYFGRNRPDGGVVSDVEWETFLAEVVTPRFPEGLTVIDANGQWRGGSGQVERERTRVLSLLHAGDAAARLAVAEIAAEYRRRFHQEAVLRERMPACAHFERGR